MSSKRWLDNPKDILKELQKIDYPKIESTDNYQPLSRSDITSTLISSYETNLTELDSNHLIPHRGHLYRENLSRAYDYVVHLNKQRAKE